MTDLSAQKATARRAIEEASEDLRALSLDIHAHPELNFQEHHAHDLVTAFLEERGFTVERSAYGLETAFAATAGSGPATIAVLCEYDALPEIGHACGHNLIAASGVAAALGMKAALGDGDGAVVVLGTPAEEGGGGKIDMIEQGAFDGVDAAMMVHPSPADTAWPVIMALHELEVEFFGKNAHAAAFPWEGVNALDAFVLAYNGIAVLRQQLPPETRVHGIVTNGGAKPNIIPDHTAADFYLRARDDEKLDALKQRVLACFSGAAEATGCRLEYRWHGKRYGNLATNEPMAEAYATNARALGKILLPAAEVRRMAGSTDFGNVSHVVPSIHPMFAIETTAGNHSPEFTQAAATPEAHAAMLTAATALALTALDLYANPERLNAARHAFRADHPA